MLDELAAPRRAVGRRHERRQPRGADRPCDRGHARPRGHAAHRRGRRQGPRQRRRSCAGGRPAAARRGVPLPARVRPDADPGLQHEHGADHGRGAARAGRPHLARGREAGRRRDGGAVRAALPRALGVTSRRRSSSCRATARAAGSCPSRSRPTSRRRGRFYASCSRRRSPARISKSISSAYAVRPPGSSTIVCRVAQRR